MSDGANSSPKGSTTMGTDGRVEGGVPRGVEVEILVDGRPVRAVEGESVAAALLAAGKRRCGPPTAGRGAGPLLRHRSVLRLRHDGGRPARRSDVPGERAGWNAGPVTGGGRDVGGAGMTRRVPLLIVGGEERGTFGRQKPGERRPRRSRDGIIDAPRPHRLALPRALTVLNPFSMKKNKVPIRSRDRSD